MGEFLTMREIGRLLGTTSHVVGKALKEVGLRTKDGKPTRAAFDGGFCAQRWSRDLSNYCWAWEKDRTMQVLREAGLAWAR